MALDMTVMWNAGTCRGCGAHIAQGERAVMFRPSISRKHTYSLHCLACADVHLEGQRERAMLPPAAREMASNAAKVLELAAVEAGTCTCIKAPPT